MKKSFFILSCIFAGFSPAMASDTISANDYGARCDNITDDTGAFQSAVNDSVNKGVQLTFRGQCKIAAINIPNGAKSVSINGHGNSLVFSRGGVNIRNTSGGNPTIYDIENIKFSSLTNYSDVAITIDGNVKGKIQNISVDGFNKGILINNSSDNRISGSLFKSFGNSYAIYITGTLDKNSSPTAYSSNNDVNNVTDVYGTGVYIGPAVQGTKIRNLRVLESWYGVYALNGPGDEDLSISDSYLEGNKAGVFADGVNLVRINNTSVDLPSSGADPNWSAFHLNGMFGGILSNSSVWGIAAAKSPVIVAEGNISITGNQITGLSNGPCMSLKPRTKLGDPPMVVSNNTCWASGGYQLLNKGGIVGTNNLWSGPSNNQWLVINFSFGN